jgi:hypothetical protein
MQAKTSMMKWAALLATLPAIAAMQPGCATRQLMQTGSGVPAAEATILAAAGDNGNTNVDIRVEHLALPWNVVAGATVYVVWFQPPGAAWQSAGALTVTDNLEGLLETMTPHRRFLVMVTPEVNGQADQPTQNAVFTASIDVDSTVL